jgi:Zyg-11 family protein
MDPTEPTSMPIEFRHKEKCIPESLLCLCLKYVVHNLKIICLETPEAYTLHEKLILPEQICDKLIEMYQSNGFEFSDNFAHLFKDTTRTRLSSVHLNNSKLVTDVGLEYLLRHDLKKITLTNCPKISHKAYTNMFERDSNLSSITIRPNKKITPYYDFSSCLQTSEITNSKKAPNLKHLVLESVDKSPESIDNKYISATLDNLSQLRILDLTYCSGVGSLQYLSKLTSIRSLILFDVDNLQENNAISSICSLKSLV